METDEARRLRNAARFADHLGGGSSSKNGSGKKRSRWAMDKGGDSNSTDPVRGTSRSLEKSYFRLTSAPKPSDVRPPEVLKRSLLHVKRKWAKEEDYEFACDQLKAIRQDLTVQAIEDELTVDVYQTHGRIALEAGDMEEYNQCQSRLKELHLAGVPGVSMDEFIGYRLIYSLYRENHREVNATMMDLSEEARKGEGVAHALGVVKAYHMGDYCTFFRLYFAAPSMSEYLMDYLVMRMRRRAFKTMVKAYLPTIPLSFIQEQLRFDTRLSLLEFLEKDVAAVFAVARAGEEAAVDVKGTRAAWARAAQLLHLSATHVPKVEVSAHRWFSAVSGEAKEGRDVEGARRALRTAQAVCFDVDSTVIAEEGIDILAEFCGAAEAVADLTSRAMGGSMPFQDALKARLDLMTPSKDTVARCLREHPPRLSPGISELVSTLHERGVVVYLVSGGFRQMIEPVADQLSIPRRNIFANRLVFDDDAENDSNVGRGTGKYVGFDAEEPTSRDGGKPKVVGLLSKEFGYKCVVMVGDGATDMQAKPPAEAFIGYGGVTVREAVRDGADWFVTDFSPLIKALNESGSPSQ
eukprot:g6363.t1